MVGTTVKLDFKTEYTLRGQFAKVAVRIDLTKPVKGTVTLDGEKIKVRYEGLPQICISCGRVGHNVLLCLKQCSIGPETASPPTGQMPTSGEAHDTSKATAPESGNAPNNGVGEWVNVQPRARQQYRKTNEVGQKQAQDQMKVRVTNLAFCLIMVVIFIWAHQVLRPNSTYPRTLPAQPPPKSSLVPGNSLINPHHM
ncbi:hypothetical protein Tsubulata_005789 [Turnera subulata]|uniref:Zinc knuckle CX2CX4HX4C domain-containing protein n=1 Tax=Turnera subulata TaxID=218843 RepID=A0A9Q0F7G3_9ROSI|nr:hypothetical protein Tsubulata_005789 [Turnera subulata]